MSLNLLSCLTGQNKAKIEWRLGVNAPKYYPIIVASGSLSNGRKSAPLTTRADVNDGWGQSGLEMSTSYFIPNKLSVKWFSYAEDKFFGGSFDLPEDTLRTLMKQGFKRPNGSIKGYVYLYVNMYPQGGIALWAEAPGSRIVEIGHFQAKEIDYDWKSMYPSSKKSGREDYNKMVMADTPGAEAYIAKHGFSQEPFKTIYRQRYNYTISIDSIPFSRTEFIQFKSFNGEMDTMEDEELESNFFKTKAVPKNIFFRWRKGMVVYFGEIDFNEDEIFKAFASMQKECKEQPFVLYLKPDFSTGKLGVCLRGNNQETQDSVEIEIKKAGRIGKSSIQPHQKK
ncbi:hypothetical protein BZG01_16380 [Labilibaculum manganireducens]|uniref:DUF2931 domain-containing protein n=1 Tax=Labilibaculum manganireducens TaxID=1940525 RepID=A0A2N3HY16_9BACT|nr:DUF2931 family protein [Labilibaculum manganireducens]PKQ62960.1 hypothetical protein BZG01_16380 [Labilibaculum manganireducens]